MKTRKSTAIAAALGGVAAAGAGAGPADAMLPADAGGGGTPPKTPPKSGHPTQGQAVTEAPAPPPRQPKPAPATNPYAGKPNVGPAGEQMPVVAPEPRRDRGPRRAVNPTKDKPKVLPGGEQLPASNDNSQANPGRANPGQANPAGNHSTPERDRPARRGDARALADTYEQIDAQDGALNTGIANRLERYGSDPAVRQRAQRIVARRRQVQADAESYKRVLDQIDEQGGALNMNTASGLREYGQDEAVVRKARQMRAAERELEEDAERERVVESGGIAESDDPGQHVLTERGFDEPTTRRGVRRFVANNGGAVGLDGVMGDRNRKTEPLDEDPVEDIDGVDEGDGFSWNQGDNDTDYMLPQGLAGWKGMLAATWYEKGEEHEDDPTPSDITRVSFVDRDRESYRHAVLVTPTEDGGFENVSNHAGGNAWHGDFMYVADTNYGVRVFDTRKIVKAPEDQDDKTGGYRYMMPEVGSYESTGADQDSPTSLRFSSLSIDRSDPGHPALVVSEYVRHGDGEDDDPESRRTRIVRWDIDPETGKLTRSRASAAYETGADEVQGAAMHDGRVYMSSGNGIGRDGTLYSGTPGENTPLDEDPWIGGSPESLYVQGDKLWSLNEHHGERTVFHAPRSNYDD